VRDEDCYGASVVREIRGGHAMIVGETLLGGTTTYTAWESALGPAVTCFVQVIAFGDTNGFDVTIETKNVDETDAQAVTATGGAFATITQAGTFQKRATGLKQLYRLKLVVSSGGEGDEKFVHVRRLAPAWERE
jgi:hypothetical protein